MKSGERGLRSGPAFDLPMADGDAASSRQEKIARQVGIFADSQHCADFVRLPSRLKPGKGRGIVTLTSEGGRSEKHPSD